MKNLFKVAILLALSATLLASSRGDRLKERLLEELKQILEKESEQAIAAKQ